MRVLRMVHEKLGREYKAENIVDQKEIWGALVEPP